MMEQLHYFYCCREEGDDGNYYDDISSCQLKIHEFVL